MKKREMTYFDLSPNTTLVQNWNLDPQILFFFFFRWDREQGHSSETFPNQHAS